MNVRSRPVLSLVLLSGVFGYAVWEYGAVLRSDLVYCGLALVLVGLLTCLPIVDGSSLPKRICLPLILLVAFVTLQVLPLPLAWIAYLSPAKASITAEVSKLVPGIVTDVIAVNPDETAYHLLRILLYVTVFLITRRLTAAFSKTPWLLAFPLLSIATAEALWGLFACARLGSACAFPTGTYVDRDHFAGMLEMVLPFGIAYSVVAKHQLDKTWAEKVAPALKVTCVVSATLIMMAAITFSLSRTAFLTMILSIFVVLTPKIRRVAKTIGWKLSLSASLLTAIIAYAAVPAELLLRFHESLNLATFGADRRMMWLQALHVIAAFPLFGCGLGSYGFTYLRYKTEMPLWNTDFVHNDYLQLLAEMGVVGCGLMLILMYQIFLRRQRAGHSEASAATTLLTRASYAAALAIGLHTFDDFNFYIPANAMEFAWICGMVVGLQPKQTLQ